ncbi:unnamed protein product [Thlaspi arvense]|uniref:MATH domain-containing protein n=1 Tax=Thlaspi arvense TaxID=13288 RepID=A0AAU9S9T4_THLAR|nr:unnamed protein product [Thlaspi arvense]
MKDGKYESLPFTAGAYNWTFILYPSGNNKDGVSGTISQYVRIDNSSLITNPEDVFAEVKFFIYNRMLNKYYVKGGTKLRRGSFISNTEYGVHTFTTAGVQLPERGYLFDGEHVLFGVDVFVAQPNKKCELFSFDEHISDPIFTWKLIRFSTLYSDSYTSDPFSSGVRDWVLKVYPNGDGYGKGNSLSLYLLSLSSEKPYVRAKLRVFNQNKSNHVEKQVDGWSNVVNNNEWGFQKFIPIEDLKDPSKGYVVDDALKVEVDMIAFSKTDRFQRK